MYFRNFSVKITKNHDKHNTQSDVAYPVLAIHANTGGMGGANKITNPENTYVLIGDQDYLLKWVAISDCEQVDLT